MNLMTFQQCKRSQRQIELKFYCLLVSYIGIYGYIHKYYDSSISYQDNQLDTAFYLRDLHKEKAFVQALDIPKFLFVLHVV